MYVVTVRGVVGFRAGSTGDQVSSNGQLEGKRLNRRVVERIESFLDLVTVLSIYAQENTLSDRQGQVIQMRCTMVVTKT